MTERGSRARVGIVGVPGGWSSERLADAFAARTGYRLLVDAGRVVADLASRRVMFGGVDLTGLDGLVMKKLGASYGRDMLDRLEVCRYIEATGVACFSKPSGVLRLLDRLSCTVTLAAAGVPIPPTVITESVEAAVAAVHDLGGAVLKPLYSTKAEGMLVVAPGDPGLTGKVAAFAAQNPVIYLQKRVRLPDRDLGVVFLGGEHLGTYARVKAPGAWSTTTRDGGHYERHAAARSVVDLAHKAQGLFDLDFTSVDVAETAGGPVVFEVSAFGGFRGLQEGLGLDAAGLYADHVLARVRRG